MKKTRKLIGIISLALVAVALISTGFATWVISRDVSTSQSGNISVDAVVDNKITVTTEWKDNKSTVKFGAKKPSSDFTTPWLTASEYDECLTVELTITVDKYDLVDDTTGRTPTYTLSVVEKNKTNYDNAVKDGYITSPTTYGSATGFTFTKGADNKGTATITLTWAWGSKFETKNPYEFYNAKTKDAYVSGSSGNIWADQAKTDLEQLKTYLDNVSFTLAINVYAKQTAVTTA